MSRTCIYVIKVPSNSRRAKGRKDVIKVGYAKDPSGRAYQLTREYDTYPQFHHLVGHVGVPYGMKLHEKYVEWFIHHCLIKAGFQDYEGTGIYGEYFHTIPPATAVEFVRQAVLLFVVAFDDPEFLRHEKLRARVRFRYLMRLHKEQSKLAKA